MCDCMKEIEERVAAKNNAARASFEHFGGQVSEVGYTPYRQDGEVSKHHRYVHIPWKFCPFCGESTE